MKIRYVRFLIFCIVVITLIVSSVFFITSVVNNKKTAPANSPIVPEKPKTVVLGVEEKPSLNIMAVGDIMLGRYVGMKLNGNYESAFSEVKPIFEQAEILFGNMESPLSDKGTKFRGKGIVLRAKPNAVEGLIYAGFNVVSIANNHILDYGTSALSQTIDILDENNISHCGAGDNIDDARKPAIIDNYGIKTAFLGYSDMYNIFYSSDKITFEAGNKKPGVAPRKLNLIIEDIKKARSKADIVVVSLHWGIEESFDVTENMVEFSHQLIDSGADVIIGHHPHQIQGVEIYKGKLIAYSLGNFIFDQNDDENKDSIILSLGFKNNKLISAKGIPLRIVDKQKVVPASPEKANIALNRLKNLSEKLGSSSKINNNTIDFEIK